MGAAGLWSAIINNQQTARARHLRHQSIGLRLAETNSSPGIKTFTANALLKHLSPFFYPVISQSGISGI